MSEPRTALPDRGRPPDEVLADLGRFGADDPDYRHGRTWSLVYYLDESLARFLAQAYETCSSANGLNPMAFRSLKRLETDVVSATARLLNGPPETCGVMTSGGTESCLLAVKTYRDLARKQRRVRRPEMILPVTAHVAWFKASEYFDVAVRDVGMSMAAFTLARLTEAGVGVEVPPKCRARSIAPGRSAASRRSSPAHSTSSSTGIDASTSRGLGAGRRCFSSSTCTAAPSKGTRPVSA